MQAYNSRGREVVFGRNKRTEVDALAQAVGGISLTGKNSFLAKKYTMPSKRSYRRKRSGRRRRRIYRKRPVATLQPYSVVRKLKTAVIYSHNPAAGNINVYQLKLNSAYDPTGDIGATQPLGFDQMTALYSRYCVVSYGFHAKAVSADNTNAIVVGFTPKTDNTSLTTYLHYLECPGTTSRHMTPDIDKIEYGSKGKIKPYFLPRGGKMLTDDTVAAATGSDPSKILYGHIWMQALDATADPAAVTVVGILYQTIIFFDPIIPARS